MKLSTLGELLRWAVGSVCLALLARTWLVMGLVVPVTVSGRSMEPTLQLGDRVLVDRTAFLRTEPRRWDVVVFRCPDRAYELCVKRIAGLPGERIELRDGRVLVDGQPVASPFDYAVRHEDWAAFRAQTNAGPDEPVVWQMSAGEYFVLGDNGPLSDDSRSWWQRPGLEGRLILGRALGVH